MKKEVVNKVTIYGLWFDYRNLIPISLGLSFGLNEFNPTSLSINKWALSLMDKTQAYGLEEWSRDKTLDLGPWGE